MTTVRTTKKLRRRNRNTARGWLAQAVKTYLRSLESTDASQPRELLAQTVQGFVEQVIASWQKMPRESQPVSSILDETVEWLMKELDVESEEALDRLEQRRVKNSPTTDEQQSSAFKGLTPIESLPLTAPLDRCPQLTRDETGFLDRQTVQALRDFHPEIVLISPQIPPNTGTIARLCAAMSCRLHLIEPIGFDVSEKSFRRAGLDYWEHVELYVHPSWDAFLALRPARRIVLVETGGRQSPSTFVFQPGDLLVFGAETFGIPQNILAQCSESQRGHLVTIPMFDRGVRSLNLANTVSIVAHCAVHSIHAQTTEDLPL